MVLLRVLDAYFFTYRLRFVAQDKDRSQILQVYVTLSCSFTVCLFKSCLLENERSHLSQLYRGLPIIFKGAIWEWNKHTPEYASNKLFVFNKKKKRFLINEPITPWETMVSQIVAGTDTTLINMFCLFPRYTSFHVAAYPDTFYILLCVVASKTVLVLHS